MQKAKVKTSYSILSDGNLQGLTSKVINSLTGNDSFTGLESSLIDLQTTLTSFEVAIEKAKGRDRGLCYVKNGIRNTLLEKLQSLANNINSQANYDLSVLISSGFTPAASGGSIQPIEAPKNFNISYTGTANELLFSASKPTYAKGLIFEYTYDDIYTNDTPQWQSLFSTNQKLTIANLKGGSQIFGRAKVLGSKNRSAMSDILQRTVPT